MIQFSTSITMPDSIDCLRRRSLAYINVRPGNSKQFCSIVLLVSEEQEGKKVSWSVRKLNRTTACNHHFPLKLGMKLP